MIEVSYKLKQSWKMLGEFFGYPDCCIEEFTTRDLSISIGPRQFHGTGFVPCEKCNELSREDLLKKIQDRRKCPEPFPKGNPQKYFKRMRKI